MYIFIGISMRKLIKHPLALSIAGISFGSTWYVLNLNFFNFESILSLLLATHTFGLNLFLQNIKTYAAKYMNLAQHITINLIYAINITIICSTSQFFLFKHFKIAHPIFYIVIGILGTFAGYCIGFVIHHCLKYIPSYQEMLQLRQPTQEEFFK